jgi:hypothetical protein
VHRIRCRVRGSYPTNKTFLTIHSEPNPPPQLSTLNYGQTKPARPASIVLSQTENTLWLPTMRPFANKGWKEFRLPDHTRYFSNPKLQVVTDIDLSNTKKLEIIVAFLERSGTEIRSPPECELWLREPSGPTTVFTPLKAWIDHGTRSVTHERLSSNPGYDIYDGVDTSK